MRPINARTGEGQSPESDPSLLEPPCPGGDGEGRRLPPSLLLWDPPKISKEEILEGGTPLQDPRLRPAPASARCGLRPLPTDRETEADAQSHCPPPGLVPRGVPRPGPGNFSETHRAERVSGCQPGEGGHRPHAVAVTPGCICLLVPLPDGGDLLLVTPGPSGQGPDTLGTEDTTGFVVVSSPVASALVEESLRLKTVSLGLCGAVCGLSMSIRTNFRDWGLHASLLAPGSAQPVPDLCTSARAATVGLPGPVHTQESPEVQRQMVWAGECLPLETRGAEITCPTGGVMVGGIREEVEREAGGRGPEEVAQGGGSRARELSHFP